MVMKKILIDSDICLDAITGRILFERESAKILQYSEDNVINGLVSAESFSNMFYVLRKLSSSDKAIRQLTNLRRIVTVGEITMAVIDQALRSEWSDFEDAIQYFCALESGCDAIVSRNRYDFRYSGLPVYNPTELISIINS
jgi:predicted nucleic acid-binding protein